MILRKKLLWKGATMSDILLCLDSESARHPGLVGLGDERLEALPWLQVCCSAKEARQLAKDAGAKEIWIVASDDMNPINLAAAIKQDETGGRVILIGDQPSGSVMSRARMAGIEVLDGRAFARHYAKAKGMYTTQRASLEGAKLGSSIVVASASGGSGKSAVAAIVATAAARLGSKVLLVDADLQFGSVAAALKDAHEVAASEVLADLEQLASLPGEHPLCVMLPPTRVEQAESLSCELPTLVDVAATRFDVVVVDAGPVWDDTLIALIERSTKTLLLVDQRASSVRAAKRALDLLIRCGVATSPLLFALNRCSKTAPYSSLDLSCALQGASVFELKDGGREVEELLGIGMAESLISERNPFAESVIALLGDFLAASGDGMPVGLSKRQGATFLGKLKGAGKASRRRDLA